MTVGCRSVQQPAPQAKLDELEQRIGRQLSTAYRDYLRAQDGGRLEDNDEAATTIFGIGDVPDWADLWQTLDVYADRVPTWLLPVADDAYGNLFCISLRDSDEGSVWFWDHEEEELDEDEPPTEDNLTYKAANWPDFLESLQPVS